METTFGNLLKEWRGRRNVSQLDLGFDANVSARHLSFLESGRSSPSRSMVLNLCEALNVPRDIRNSFLNAAGYTAAFRRRDLNEAEMAPVMDAMRWTLDRHNPFPAMAVDIHWKMIELNNSAQLLFSALEIGKGDCLLDLLADKPRMEQYLENWDEVARHTISRLRVESLHLGGDPFLDDAVKRIAEQIEPRGHKLEGVLPPITPAKYCANGMVFSLFSTIAQFGTAEDISLADLKIELFFPADEPTKKMFLAMQ